ncbi:hypothetical protein QM012_006893 [Aureobasidium pullulans]|uniref:C2H2-type domain-containing protein n=1 Tax=Aureobasidium pullulans TaxID=5580 RepID=A0ABR0TPW4_AURPU
MAWHNAKVQHEFFEDSLNQDFELFPSTTQSFIQDHGSSRLLPLTGATSIEKKVQDDRHGAEIMIPSTKDEEAWLAWYRASTAQEMHTLPVAKVKTKLSISDSGYGSMDYSDRHDVEAGPSAQPDMIDSTNNKVSEYCEICSEESDKRRYFSNNADRRKHMLTHTRPFKCDVPGCDNLNGFASPHDLARHKKTCHSVLTVKTSKFYYRCAAPSCQKKDKIWPRKDNFKAHLEGTHRYNEVQVAELLVKSECTPEAVQLLSDVANRQKAKGRKTKSKRRFRKDLSSEDEDSNVAESPIGEIHQDFESSNFLPQRVAKSPELPPSATHPPISFLSPVHSLPVPTTYTDPPSILVSGDFEVDMRVQSSPIEMMDTSADLMDDVYSPYLMVGVTSPEELAPTPTSYSSSTYADSLFESDLDDMTTENDFDLDLAERETIFQPLLRPAVHCLLAAYSSRQNAGGNSGQESSNSSYSSSFNGSNGPSGSRENNLSFLPLGGKRRRTLGEQDDGDDDEQPSKRKSKAVRPDEELPPLACPFVKFDPLKHDKCYTFVLKGVSRVKQHLERVHSIPIHCPKCYSIFRNNAEARDKHVREDTCQTAPERRLEGIDEMTMRKIKRRVTGRSVSESWYSIFSLLFPGARKPESPFMDTTLSAELSAFRDFCTREGHEIVTSIVGANMPSGTGHQQDQLEDFTRQVFQRSIDQLFLQWQSRSRSVTSAPILITQPVLPPTPPSTFLQDLNDMGINDTFTMADEEPLLPTQQFPDLDIPWMDSELQQHDAAQQQQQQLQQQWIYFGEILPMNQQQQFWNDIGVLDGMGGWSG